MNTTYDDNYVKAVVIPQMDMNFYPGCRVVVQSGGKHRRMIVTDVYPHILICKDGNGKKDCFNVGDLYSGRLRKLE